ncbi:MAG TPA: hypothetical protein VLN26_05765 [Gaiellaceae bacterium]|nr:hypothetical protein [Gaiellaceae bacterium]
MTTHLVNEDDRRELELVVREADLIRREARQRRESNERDRIHEERELQLNRREQALAVLAGELAAERERLTALQTRLLEDMRRLEQRRLQSSPRWFAAPEAELDSTRDDDWWAKVLGREAPAA